MPTTLLVLDGFPDREEKLAAIKRYKCVDQAVMFYRTNDLIHSRRVLWHLEAALPDIQTVYGDHFRVDFARVEALVHDDAELLVGDAQLHAKENMNPDELAALDRKERAAITQMVEQFTPLMNGFSYRDLLLAAKDKPCLEAQFVSFFDKMDGAGEAWHEVFAGNPYFLRPAGGQGTDQGYVRRLNAFPQKYSQMQPFFQQFPNYLPQPFDFPTAMARGRPHTCESLQQDSGYPPYERWKRTVMECEGLDLLVTQIEFP
ncbi:MAG: HD domain-containing protein [Candidatus Woesearchaeota archaeon]|nr:HD domain-containing protein [Candidatus Woesearchaeota archaeon]